MSKIPKIIEILGNHRGTDRMSDANLKLLHVYLMMALIEAEGVLRQRGLAGMAVNLRIHRPAETRLGLPAE